MAGMPTTCLTCGSSRLVSAPDLDELHIAHLDCDAFFAAVEKRDNPALADKPVIVGGGQRGVVSTCCYTARLYGVRSAMPMFKALKLCPHAVVVKSDFEKYRQASNAIRERMNALTPLVQTVSIDEAYLDLSGTTTVHGKPPVAMLMALQSGIKKDLGITVSIGLSSNKFLAKTASELDKPEGFAAIHPTAAPDLLAPNPPGFLHGVGPKLSERLQRDGFETVLHLQEANLKDLIGRYGETGLWLHQRAKGIDHRIVTTGGERKSISSETTFSTDIAEITALEDHLWALCDKTSRRAKANGLEGSVVTLKLKTARFKSFTRRHTLPYPTQLAVTLFNTARHMLQKDVKGDRFRLIGVGLSELEPARTEYRDLLDRQGERRAEAERAVDKARSRFGDLSVVTGRSLRLQHQKERSTKHDTRGDRDHDDN